jgi:glycosyltransferase involved in cell wall biosynthesis
VKQISLCLTNYNRNSLLFKSFEQVLEDERIGEVVISDDNSDSELLNDIERKITHPKIKLFRHPINKGVYDNKHRSVVYASNEWCIVFDSDNIIDKNYLDVIYSIPEWNETTAYCPDFAKPVFDYTKFRGTCINKTNVARAVNERGFDCLINTMNFFINRNQYLSIWKPKENIKGADSIWFNYQWLLAGNELYIVPHLEYYHRVHDGSYFQSVARESTPVTESILRQISKMR